MASLSIARQCAKAVIAKSGRVSTSSASTKSRRAEMMGVPKHEYIMDYIPDKKLYQAVMYARDGIRKYGLSPLAAIRKAAYKYKVDMSDVAKYLGQRNRK